MIDRREREGSGAPSEYDPLLGMKIRVQCSNSPCPVRNLEDLNNVRTYKLDESLSVGFFACHVCHREAVPVAVIT